jgi:hypothetical protein
LVSANRLCAPAPSHSEAKTLRISQRVRGTGDAEYLEGIGRNGTHGTSDDKRLD